MEFPNIDQIINSDYLIVGVTLGILALFSWLLIPRMIGGFKRRMAVKEIGLSDKISSFAVVIRDGEILKLTRGRFTREGSLLADKKAWLLDDVKPYFLKSGWSTRPCFIVDARKQVYYRFNNIDNEKQRQIAGSASDPELLKRFTDSTIVQKLTTAKTDKTMLFMVFIMGMFAFFMVQQFIPK